MEWIRKGASNTCTIRATLAFNAIGINIGAISNARWKDGKVNGLYYFFFFVFSNCFKKNVGV